MELSNCVYKSTIFTIDKLFREHNGTLIMQHWVLTWSFIHLWCWGCSITRNWWQCRLRWWLIGQFSCWSNSSVSGTGDHGRWTRKMSWSLCCSDRSSSGRHGSTWRMININDHTTCSGTANGYITWPDHMITQVPRVLDEELELNPVNSSGVWGNSDSM